MAQRLAVLIDGENIRGNAAEELFDTVSKLGNAIVRRVYGNFTNSQARTWLSPIARYGIIAQQVCTAKNAADFALIIDAMDLLYTARIDAFCIVSGDNDFIPLATRLREKNVTVYGFYDCQPLHNAHEIFTEVFPLQCADPATIKLSSAIEATAVDGWAPLSKLGQSVRPADYKCSSLKKLIAGRKRFELHADGQRVRIKA